MSKRNEPVPAPAAESRKADKFQRRSIERGERLVQASRAPYQVKVDREAGAVDPACADPDYVFALASSLGSSSDAFLASALNEIGSVTLKGDGSLNGQDINAGLAFIAGGEPQNEVESTLLLQMYATHVVAMRCMRTMADQGSIAASESYGALGVKLMRTFTAQVEALSKLKRGGEQVVRHIHVDNRGGQAVIAENVHTGGGRIGKGAEQSDATAGLCPALLGEDPAGHPLPSTRGEGPKAMSHARRHKPRRAQGKQERAQARDENG